MWAAAPAAGGGLAGAGAWREPPRAAAGAGIGPATRALYLVLVEGPTVLDLALARGLASGTAGATEAAWPVPAVAPGAAGAAGAGAGDGPEAPAAALAALAADVAARQAPARAAILAAGATIESTYDAVLSGFLISAAPGAAAALADAPGVRAVAPAPRWTLDAPAAGPLALPRAVPHVGAAALAAAGGPTGRGVTIAVIDSGVDYTHRALGGSGDPADYARNDEAVVEQGTFPNAKVIGGYDFAGARYTGSNTPVPDPDPLDVGGHGTHVAGIAAARDGAASGVARDARVVALKVFGTAGSSSLVTDALEWCVDARLGRPVPGAPARVDVVNMSLGAPWASALEVETEAVARVVAAGIVVVGSAGNSGDVAFIGGGPGSAPTALGVASTVGPGLLGDKVRAHGPGGPLDLEALAASGDLSRPVPVGRPLRAPLVDIGRACLGDAIPEGATGRVALVARGTCTFREKLGRAQAAGAIAAVVVDDGRGMVTMGGGPPALDLPAFMIGQVDGARLRDGLAAGQGWEVELSAAFAGTLERRSAVDTVSSFSSRGPSRSGVLKPDLGAPGTLISAPAVGSGVGARALSGTSMSGPMVAGGVAVVIDGLAARGAAPLAATEVAALVATSARSPVWEGDNRTAATAALARGGNGRLDLGAAAASRTLVTSGEAWRAEFAPWAAAAAHVAARRVTVRNLAGARRHFALSMAWADVADAGRGVSYEVAPARLALEGGAAGVVTVTLRVAPAALPAPELADGRSVLNGDGRFGALEWDARLEVVEVDAAGAPLPAGDVARVAVGGLGRAAADLRPRALLAPPDAAGRAEFAFTAVGARGGPVWPFVLAAEDDVERRIDPAYDVDLIGARLVPAAAAGQWRVEFAVHTRGARLSPYDAETEVHLDLDRDGTVDRILDVDDATYRQTRTQAEPIWTGLLQTLVGDGGGLWRALAPVHTRPDARWIVLGADLADLGRPAGPPAPLDYVVAHYARLSSGGYDTVPDGALQGDDLRRPLTLDAAAAPRAEPAVALDVAPGGAGADAVLAVTWPAPDAPDAPRILALMPDAPPGAGDAFVLGLGAAGRPGTVPTAPPSPAPPSPTPTPTPTPTTAPTAPSEPTATPVPASTPAATDEPITEPTTDPADPSPVATGLPGAPTAGVTPEAPEPTPPSPTPGAPRPTASLEPPSTPAASPTPIGDGARGGSRRVFLPFAQIRRRR